MKIKFYNSKEYHNATTMDVALILGNTPPSEMTDEEREALQTGKEKPMCNFPANGGWMSVPWEFVISIE